MIYRYTVCLTWQTWLKQIDALYWYMRSNWKLKIWINSRVMSLRWSIRCFNSKWRNIFSSTVKMNKIANSNNTVPMWRHQHVSVFGTVGQKPPSWWCWTHDCSKNENVTCCYLLITHASCIEKLALNLPLVQKS